MKQMTHLQAAIYLLKPLFHNVTPAVNSVQLNLGDFSYAA